MIMNNGIKILIVEDDDDINSLLYDILSSKGYCVKSAYSGTEALIYLQQDKYTVVLLDLMLPGKNGKEILNYVRENSDIPVLIISAKEEIGIRAKMLRSGADDYITKPFDVDEVLARIEANLRRYNKCIKFKSDKKSIIYKEICINNETREVTVNNNIINLTVREFNILELLMRNPNKVFSKANLFKSIWGENYICDDNTITVHISNLRNKIIKSGAKNQYIKTIWGIGYKMEV